VLLDLSRVAQLEGKHEESLQYCEQSLRLFESGAVESNGIVRGGVYQCLGNRLNWVSRNEEAERHLRKAIVEYDQAGGPEHPYSIDARRELGSFLGWVGRREESRSLLERALQAQQDAKGDDDPQLTAPVRLDLGRVLMMRGEYAAAERELQRVIQAWKVSGAPLFAPQMHLARIHTEQGRFDAVEQELQDAEATAIKLFGKGSWWHATSLNRLGALHLTQGKLQDAQRYFRRTLADTQDPQGPIDPNGGYAEVGLLRIALMQRDPTVVESAPKLLSQMESSRWRGDMPDELAAVHMLLGVALLRAGKATEAETHLQTAVRLREQMDAPESPLLAEARLYLAQQQHLAGERASARKIAAQAADAYRMQQYIGPQYRELLAETRRLISF
jgi:tetratricopeptide (TPR) repeat protein